MIADFLRSLVDPTQAQVLIYMIAANVILGIGASVLSGTFELNKLLNFWKRVLTVFGAYIAVSIVGTVLTDFEAMRTVIWATLIAYMTAQIVGNLKDLGLLIPKGVSKFIER